MKKEILIIIIISYFISLGLVSAVTDYSSCSKDSDCILTVPSLLIKCYECDPFNCNMFDVTDSEVLAVNKNWKPDCPSREKHTCVACIGGISGDLPVRCMNNKCIKDNSSNCTIAKNPECSNGELVDYKMKYANGCQKPLKCMKTLSDGVNQMEIKITPEEASQIVAEMFGKVSENEIIEIKNRDNVVYNFVYSLIVQKEVKILGLFKKNTNIGVEINVQTGEVVKVYKPWWAFMATGI